MTTTSFVSIDMDTNTSNDNKNIFNYPIAERIVGPLTPIENIHDIGDFTTIECPAINNNTDYYTFWMYLFGYTFAIIGTICCLVFGILALIPAKPFSEQHLTEGVVMIVLSITGIVSLAGALAGIILGAIFGTICKCIC